MERQSFYINGLDFSTEIDQLRTQVFGQNGGSGSFFRTSNMMENADDGTMMMETNGTITA